MINPAGMAINLLCLHLNPVLAIDSWLAMRLLYVIKENLIVCAYYPEFTL